MWRFIPLAHGALGPLDDIMIVAALIIFVAMLAVPPILTVIKRNKQITSAPNVEQNLNAPMTDAPSLEQKTSRKADHYRLD